MNSQGGLVTHAILSELSGYVLTLSINNPTARNAWNPAMEQALRAALQAADVNPAVRVVVLTGAGATFCPGADPKALSAPERAQGGGYPGMCAEPRFLYMLALRKPLIAAINGAAAGVGMCLTLFCDLRFMVEDAKITTSFVRRGLIAEHGSAWLLTRLIGSMNAADLLLSGRVLTGREAESLGLVRALARDGFMHHVQAYAQDLATHCSPRSMAVIKAQLSAVWQQDIQQAMILARLETEHALGAVDFKEGVASYLERRTPGFPELI